MKRLIITADDFGCDPPRNRGIFQLIQAGRVTAVSMLPNGPAFDDAMDLITEPGIAEKDISVGVHVNLSQGRPLTSGLHLLTGPDGLFPGKNRFLETMALPCPSENNEKLTGEIEKEMAAQIERLLHSGLKLGHLDGHHHAHIFPMVMEITIRLARRYAIPRIRIPCEPVNLIRTLAPDRSVDEEALFFSRYAEPARVGAEIAGLETTDHFRGLYLKGRLSPAVFEELMETLSEGVTELMVHPGKSCLQTGGNPFSAFSTHDREKELSTLLDDSAKTILEKTGVFLVSSVEAKDHGK